MPKQDALKQTGLDDRDPMSGTGENTNDETYGSTELATGLPESVFPDSERDPRRIVAAVRDELMLDGNSRQNLATFCQTWEEPEIHQLMDACIPKARGFSSKTRAVRRAPHLGLLVAGNLLAQWSAGPFKR